jgi:hypothetical protein
VRVGLTTEVYTLQDRHALLTVNRYDGRDLSERQHLLVGYFNFDIRYIKAKAREVVGRNLTPEEWGKYFAGTRYQRAFEDLP